MGFDVLHSQINKGNCLPEILVFNQEIPSITCKLAMKYWQNVRLQTHSFSMIPTRAINSKILKKHFEKLY